MSVLDVAATSAVQSFSLEHYERDDATTYSVKVGPRVELVYEKTEDGWMVEEIKTGIFGFGETLQAALGDTRQALCDHRDVLQRQDELSASLQEQLEYLCARTF